MKYFTTTGRMRRLHYWLYNIPLILFGKVAFPYIEKMPDPITALATFALATGLVIWLTSNLMSQRLRDQDRSPWLQVIGWVPYAALMATSFAMGMGHASAEAGQAIESVMIGWMIIFNLFIWCPAGTKGPNQYGPDPLEQEVAQPFNLTR